MLSSSSRVQQQLQLSAANFKMRLLVQLSVLVLVLVVLERAKFVSCAVEGKFTFKLQLLSSRQ